LFVGNGLVFPGVLRSGAAQAAGKGGFGQTDNQGVGGFFNLAAQCGEGKGGDKQGGSAEGSGQQDRTSTMASMVMAPALGRWLICSSNSSAIAGEADRAEVMSSSPAIA